MRVLVLSTHVNLPGSRERLRAIANAGCELLVGVPEHAAAAGENPANEPFELRAIRTSRPIGTADGPDAYVWHKGTIKKLISEFAPDLVHLEARPESELARTVAGLCKRAGVPFVLMETRAHQRPLGMLERRRANAALKTAAGAIGSNRFATALLSEVAPNLRATTIPNVGITIPAPVSRTLPTELTFGFIGRLSPERGADVMIEALGRTYGRWRLIIAGTGPEQESLEAAVQRLGLASRVYWAGGIHRTLLDTLWNQFDCLVVPSRETPEWTETQAPYLLEAMARGIGPIVSAAGVLPELVGDVGIVCNGVDSMCEALQSWVADPAACRAAGERARELVTARNAADTVAARTLEFWESIARSSTTVAS